MQLQQPFVQVRRYCLKMRQNWTLCHIMGVWVRRALCALCTSASNVYYHHQHLDHVLHAFSNNQWRRGRELATLLILGCRKILEKPFVQKFLSKMRHFGVENVIFRKCRIKSEIWSTQNLFCRKFGF